MKLNRFAAQAKGFSLVELLVVIAVIGLLAALAIPQLFADFNTINQAKIVRNAQEVASMASQVRIAGVKEIDQMPIEDAIRTFINGVQGRGHLRTVTFKLDPLSQAEIQAVAARLTKENGMLQFRR